MKCTKCSGRLVRESESEVRCLNCGKRISHVPLIEPKKESPMTGTTMTVEERILARIERTGVASKQKLVELDKMTEVEAVAGLKNLEAAEKIKAWPMGRGCTYTLPGAENPWKAAQAKGGAAKKKTQANEGPPPAGEGPAREPAEKPKAAASAGDAPPEEVGDPIALPSDLRLVQYLQENLAELLDCVIHGDNTELILFRMASSCMAAIARKKEAA